MDVPRSAQTRTAQGVTTRAPAVALLLCCALFLVVRSGLFVAGDGREGEPQFAPYDAIHVGAAALGMPHKLISQLKVCPPPPPRRPQTHLANSDGPGGSPGPGPLRRLPPTLEIGTEMPGHRRQRPPKANLLEPIEGQKMGFHPMCLYSKYSVQENPMTNENQFGPNINTTAVQRYVRDAPYPGR